MVNLGTDDAAILSTIASENIAKEINISWWWAPDDPNTLDRYFLQMASQGQTVFVASGDDGGYTSSSQAHAWPAEGVNVTAVGGTHLWTNSPGGSYQQELAWGSSGGGPSPDEIAIPSWQGGIVNSSNGASTIVRNVPVTTSQNRGFPKGRLLTASLSVLIQIFRPETGSLIEGLTAVLAHTARSLLSGHRTRTFSPAWSRIQDRHRESI